MGGAIFKSLVESEKFNVTAISRQDSSATFPSGTTVKKGDYESSDFLESALKGQDVLILTFAGMANLDLQSNFIKAAAKVGVPWILPNEYGSDGANSKVAEAISVTGVKEKYRAQIEELDKSSWIGVANNPWFEFV